MPCIGLCVSAVGSGISPGSGICDGTVNIRTIHLQKQPITKQQLQIKYNPSLVMSSVPKGAHLNPYPAWYIYLNFLSLEVMSRCHDPLSQVVENYSHLFNLIPNINKS